MEHGIEGLTSFATDFIRKAGDEALAFYGKGRQSVKFDEDLVTQAELHLTDYFQKQLDEHFPTHQIFTNAVEEVENSEYTHDGSRYLWIFDPLDGAANFQAGIPLWGVSLALFENFWPVFSTIYMPATEDLFYAQGGGKAYRNQEEIRVTGRESINDESLLFTYSRFHQTYQTHFPGKIRNLGCTTAHICYIAMGRADCAIIANESYQEMAAAQIIIESAGGKIYKMDGSNFYLGDYINGQKIEDHLLVLAPNIYEQVKNSLQRR